MNKVLGTSTTPIMVTTDVGPAYVKVLGNPEGPSALACEWIGTALARWLGLRTFDAAIVTYPEELRVELSRGCFSQSGPALATREVDGIAWSGEVTHLQDLENTDDIAGLVVLDTWLRNPDRYFPRDPRPRRNLRNVFFSAEGAPRGRYKLLAIDHTACLRQDQELSKKHLRLGEERDIQIYGLFPEFIGLVTRERVTPFLERLQALTTDIVEAVIRLIPGAWLGSELRSELGGFCVRRAHHVAANLETWLEGPCAW